MPIICICCILKEDGKFSASNYDPSVLYIEPVPINTVFRWFPENPEQTTLAGKVPIKKKKA